MDERTRRQRIEDEANQIVAAVSVTKRPHAGWWDRVEVNVGNLERLTAGMDEGCVAAVAALNGLRREDFVFKKDLQPDGAGSHGQRVAIEAVRRIRECLDRLEGEDTPH